MSNKASLPRAIRRNGDVLLQLSQGLLWVRRQDCLAFVSDDGPDDYSGGWLVRQSARSHEPDERIAVTSREEAQAALTAVWQAFRWTIRRSAFIRGIVAGWVSLIIVLAVLSPLGGRHQMVAAKDPAGRDMALRVPIPAPPAAAPSSVPPPSSLAPSGQPGGAIDRMN
ncbi:hypothetical protein [Telmatospirillum siberiense]|uniref:Uncharacterized protein n=1 Tax=Telmatospirillum siberiense TaxID=382514 RepID=A0A2N3PNK4_9PROT|nr:hypothetical protein [Telmatospirillum siberiense]PKU21975.1 hypothetical protein CWS72_24025 [Telmatospirillum siberiense]